MNAEELKRDIESKKNQINENVCTLLSKIIKRIEKNPRRNGYKDNLSAINKMIDDGIWYKLIDPQMNSFFAALAKLYGVKRTDFYSWQKNLTINIGWLPKHLKNSEYSRVFTPLQFHAIEKLIDSVSESHNIPITNMLIKELLRCYYFNLIVKPQPNLQFNCSSHYVTKIKQLLSYSTRVFHPKRRPSASDEIINKFKQRCQYIFSHAKPEQIVNSDESFFRCYQSFNKTWDKIGSKDVYINSDADEKEGFTFLATIVLMEEKFLWNFYQKELQLDAKRIGLDLIII